MSDPCGSRDQPHLAAPRPAAAVKPPAGDRAHGEPDRFHVLPREEHDRWDDFVLSGGQGSLFHTTWWYRAWGMEPVVQVLCDDHGTIQAGHCYSVGRRWGSRAIVRPPITCMNGPVFASPTGVSRHKQNTHDKKMLLLAIQALPRLGVYDFVLRPSDLDVMPFLWNDVFDTLVGYTYVLPRAERDTWMQHASKTQRWSVRRASRQAEDKGLSLEEVTTVEETLAVLDDTAELKNYSLAGVRERILNWWEAVRARGAGRAYLLRDREGRAASAAVMVHDERFAYYVLGGVRHDLRQGSLVNVLLTHRMVHDAHAMGLDFDFEGSVLPGVERFFRSLGGQLRPVYRVVKLPALLPYLIWQSYRYGSKHRKRRWAWYE